MSELSIASPDELRVIEALRAGDENAFRTLVQQHGPAMLRVALSYVRSRAVAEEVVQEAWLGILRGLDRFEGRSSLKTWIFHIVANIARTRAQREVGAGARHAPKGGAISCCAAALRADHPVLKFAPQRQALLLAP